MRHIRSPAAPSSRTTACISPAETEKEAGREGGGGKERERERERERVRRVSGLVWEEGKITPSFMPAALGFSPTVASLSPLVRRCHHLVANEPLFAVFVRKTAVSLDDETAVGTQRADSTAGDSHARVESVNQLANQNQPTSQL